MRTLTRLVLSLVLLLGLSATASAQDMFQQEVQTEKDAVIAANLAIQTIAGGYELVDTPTLKKWIDEGKKMLIVDTMPHDASYLKGHIPGARQFLFPIPAMKEWDAKETEDKAQADFEKLLGPDKELPIVFYCGFVKCTRSHNGALWAKKLGYKNVYRQPGGIYAWKGAGYPVEEGAAK